MNHLKFILTVALCVTLSTASFSQTTLLRERQQSNVRNQLISKWLEIRKIPINVNFRDEENTEEGIVVYKCYQGEGCAPLVDEILTITELRSLLIKTNRNGGIGSGIALSLLIAGSVIIVPIVLTGTTLQAILAGGVAAVGLVGSAEILPPFIKNGSLLRKLLSQKDVLVVRNLDKLEEDLKDIMNKIVAKRDSLNHYSK